MVGRQVQRTQHRHQAARACLLPRQRPEKDGHAEAIAKLIAEHGPLPHTLTHLSGRLDGGAHRFYLRPTGKLTTKLLGPGFDIKDSSGYLVAPRGAYATGKYLEVDAPIVDAPPWLVQLIVEEPVPPQPKNKPQQIFWANHGYSWSQSPVDVFTDNIAGPTCSCHTVGPVVTATPTLTAPVGCTRHTRRCARPRSNTESFSSTPPTRRSIRPASESPTATPDFGRGPELQR